MMCVRLQMVREYESNVKKRADQFRALFLSRSIVGAVERAVKTTSAILHSLSLSFSLFFHSSVPPFLRRPERFRCIRAQKCHAQVSLRIQVSLKARQHNTCDFFHNIRV